jgi:hypothetical protein
LKFQFLQCDETSIAEVIAGFLSPGVPESQESSNKNQHQRQSQGTEINGPSTRSSLTNAGRKRKASSREGPTENVLFEGPGQSLIASSRRAREEQVPSHLNRAQRLLLRKAKQQASTIDK